MGKPFKCNGGEIFSNVGASFFISYLYYLKVDKNHKAWDNLESKNSKSHRISLIEQSSIYYKDWIDYVTNVMIPSQLNKNEIGLSDIEVVDMAKKLVPYV